MTAPTYLNIPKESQVTLMDRFNYPLNEKTWYNTFWWVTNPKEPYHHDSPTAWFAPENVDDNIFGATLWTAASQRQFPAPAGRIDYSIGVICSREVFKRPLALVTNIIPQGDYWWAAWLYGDLASNPTEVDYAEALSKMRDRFTVVVHTYEQRLGKFIMDWITAILSRRKPVDPGWGRHQRKKEFIIGNDLNTGFHEFAVVYDTDRIEVFYDKELLIRFPEKVARLATPYQRIIFNSGIPKDRSVQVPVYPKKVWLDPLIIKDVTLYQW